MPELLLVATTAALDQRDLVRALDRVAPEGVGVRAAPGLLARGRDGGELVRDTARGRGAVVVVVVPGGPDLLNHALLTVEGARAAGLAVGAVVVAGSGPGDQRDHLREHAGVDVVDLPDPATPSRTVATWPLGAWAAAEPVPVGLKPGAVALAPYGAWEPRPAPDPRSAGRDAIDPILLDIVAAEGPVLASRAYGLFNRAAGSKKLTTIARAPLSSSAYRLRGQGRVDIDTAADSPDREDVLRPAGSPPVRVRDLGPRTLDEVPLAELAELMDRLCTAGADDLARAALDAYGLVRLTSRAQERLYRAQALLAGGA